MREIIEHEGVKYRKVAREAREGDYVVVTSSEDTSQYQNGEVHIIADVRGSTYYLRDIFDEERASFLWRREFAVLEPVPPTLPKHTDAAVGDTIRITTDEFNFDNEYYVGDTFEVESVWGGAGGVDTVCGLELLAEEIEVVHKESEASNNVNSPSHYTQGGVEVIEIIAQTVSGYDDGFTAHCVGTATKYLNRAPHKHETPLEDLKKAAKYLEFAIEHEEKKRK